MRFVCLALGLWAVPAAAQVERFAVIAGNNVGSPGEAPLRFAEEDAAKVYAVLKDLGGFLPENMVLLRGEDAATLRRALITANDRVRRVTGDRQPVLFVYYSGHADARALHTGGTTLDLAELEQLVRGSAAAFRLLVLDSCRSGGLTRVKGGRAAPPFAIRVDERLAGEGAVFLTSSAANEDAQESDELRGSFFTHYLVSGLLGPADANGDDRVVLEEAYRYAYENTVRASSRTLAGLQHPTFRYELRGRGGVVLTTPRARSRRRGQIELPAGRGYLVMRAGPNGAVVAEVQPDDRERRVSVPAGRYFVRGRGPSFLLEGHVAVEAGATLRVEDRELQRVEYARLVRKGGATRATHGPLAGYLVRSALRPGATPCHGFFAGYAFDLRRLTVSPRASACFGGFENQTLRATADEAGAEVRLAMPWDVPGLTLEVAVTVGMALLRETFVTTGVAPDRNSAAGHVGAGVGVSRDLPRGCYLVGEVAVGTYFFRQQETGGSSVHAAFAVRGAVGAGKRF